jgi:hypothetical protein
MKIEKLYPSKFGSFTPNKNENLVHLRDVFPLTSELNIGKLLLRI